ncbi:histidine kinase dimerization/phosphoacceptor domain-containing protein [Cryptosporangium minutisporangium]|uniref:Histidine kinase n=1 Tax=Cryptosporangium minutisporangium TaxID=113569 RepID=A0ABP6T622_9ACTN
MSTAGTVRRAGFAALLFVADLCLFANPSVLAGLLRPAPGALFSVLVAASGFAALYWRHRAPVGVLWLTCSQVVVLFCLATNGLVPHYMPTLSVLVATYTLGAVHARSARYLPVATAALCATALDVMAWNNVEPEIAGRTTIVVGCALAGFGAWTAGRARRASAYRDTLLEIGRLAVAQRITAQERLEAARVSQHALADAVSAMVMQAAGAGQVLRRDPGRTATALRRIEDIGGRAVQDLRQTLAAMSAGPLEVKPSGLEVESRASRSSEMVQWVLAHVARR